MKHLPLELYRGELYADSRDVAKILDVDPRGLFQEVLNNYEDLIKLGCLITNDKGFALMTFEQWVLILGNNPNCDGTPEAKTLIVRTFSKARKQQEKIL